MTPSFEQGEKMNPEVKAKWLAALRSGEYEQTTETLKQDGCFCCLGVLSDLHAKETGNGEWREEDGVLYYEVDGFAKSDVLPHPVAKWAGLDDESPSVKVNLFSDDGCAMMLAELNDSGTTFEEIADLIEAQL
jgi:hypothetical protein